MRASDVRPDGTAIRPRVSVIIPAYNAAAYIRESITSALDQPGVDVDVIVVDDGSTDDTARLAREFEDRRVTIIRQQNAGVAAARNRGLDRATGDFVGFLDADDRLLPGWCERVTGLLDGGATIAVTDAFIVDASNERFISRYFDESTFPPLADQPERILIENFIPSFACVRLVDIRQVGGFNEDRSMMGAEDWDLWIRLLLLGGRAALYEEPLAIYRRGHASLSSRRAAMKAAELTVLAQLSTPHLPRQLIRARRFSMRVRRGQLAYCLADEEVEARPWIAAWHYIHAGFNLRQPRLVARAAGLMFVPSHMRSRRTRWRHGQGA